MIRRRPGSRPMPPGASGHPSDGEAAGEGALGVWYVALISAVLLIALAVYAAYLYQQVKEWRSAADQLSIGQEMLRFDRDEILQKVREREVTLSTLEAAYEQDRTRLQGLENQRKQLQGNVLRLTQELARSEQQSNGAVIDVDRSTDLDRMQRERDQLVRELAQKSADIEQREATLASLELALAEQAQTLEARDARIEEMLAGSSTVEQDLDLLRQELAERQRGERQRQIIRGHQASLGDVKPFIAELQPEQWSVIESWLALQLRRPMAVPDLSSHGWSYEGARLLGSPDGPPMAMLLYADAEERPASLTIVRDGAGERPLEARNEGGFNLVEWREERHAFVLAGEESEDAMTAIAIELQNEPPMMTDDAVVPASRYIRPAERPDDLL